MIGARLLITILWSTLLTSLCYHRGADGASCSLPVTEYNYYDCLRVNSSLVQEIEGATESNIFRVTDAEGATYRLADIVSFFPFTDGTNPRDKVQDYALSALLAIHHFNNAESPITNEAGLKDCNVRLTTELFDTQFSPINSTRIFTSVLQRNHSLEQPLPAAVLGAYRSATTSPLAILSGVNNIPQISYASTSADFDVKEQYPLFGRTVHSSTGEARVALDYFKSLHASHIGLLFVTDSYGSALQKAFQDAASEEGIVTESVSFSYSADPNGPEIWNAVAALARTKFRIIYAICFENQYAPIMEAASTKGMTGGDYLWIFPGFDKDTFQQKAVFEQDSPVAKATKGIGLIVAMGGFLPEIQLPNTESVAPLEGSPTTGYEKLRTAWRKAITNPSFTAYVRSKFPASLDIPEVYYHEPNSGSPFVYDAITSLGLSLCAAGNETELVTGPQIYSQFTTLNFEGASGQVKIVPETGTRDYETMTFVVWNVQDLDDLPDDRKVRFQLAPTNVYKDGFWRSVPGMEFVYGDGNTDAPDSLPPVNMDMNYIGTVGRAVGYSLMAIVFLGSLISFFWLYLHRTEQVVRSSQPIFLLMVSVGSIVMASTIIPLSIEEPVTISPAGLDMACMSAPWLYVIGSAIAFSALFAKTRGVHKAYTNPELKFIHVSSFDIFGTFVFIFSLNLVVLLTWTFAAPLEWNRIDKDSTDIFDRPVESYGTCSSVDALPYAVVTLVLNILILILANVWAYQARNIETEYHESRYIGISLASVLQAWCMGIPILIVVWDNSQAKFFVEAGIIFVSSSAVLFLIYVPKMLAIRADRVRQMQEKKRMTYSHFTARSRRNQFLDDEEKVSTDPVREDDSSNGSIPPDSPAVTTLSDGIDAGVAMAAAAEAVRNSHDDDTVDETSKSDAQGERVQVQRKSLSVRFKPTGSLKSQDSISGIKVLHNPRSSRNLEVCGGRELSRKQLLILEQDIDNDESNHDEESDHDEHDH